MEPRGRDFRPVAGGLLLGIGVLLGFMPAMAQAALSSVPDDDWVTNGSVTAMARSGNTVYLGGNFTRVGPRTGPAVTFTGGSSTPDASFPQVSGGEGVVDAAVSDGAGGWYIGGNFTHVGGVARTGLAHVEAGGTIDPNFAPSAEVTGVSAVQALALSGSTLYVGGSFRAIDGTSRNGLAAVNTSDGSLQSWNPTSGNSTLVDTLAISGGTLYVGGGFTGIAGQSRDSLAAFVISTGELTSWEPQATGSSPLVRALAVSGSTVYLAGLFDHIDGETRNGFAAVEISGALTSWNPEASGGCSTSLGYSLAATGTVVYAGGCFSHIGGQARSGFAALDPTSGNATSWNPASSGAVESIAVSGSTIYVAGGFTQIGGQARNGVAALDATTAEATSWNPNLNIHIANPYELVPGTPTVAVSGSQVFVSGDFSSAGGVARKDLAAIDTTTGEATAWNPGLEPAFTLFTVPVYAISVAGGLIYVGGSFWSVGGQPRTDLAALDSTTGDATSWNPGATSVFPENGHVSALVATAQTVYVGGSFTTLAGRAQRYLGAVDTTSGAATSWSPVVSAPSAATEHGASPISSLVLSGTSLYIGGGFTGLGTQSRTGAGAVSTETAELTAWDPVLSGTFPGEAIVAKILAVAGSTAYISSNTGLTAVDSQSGAALPWHPGTSSNQAAAAVANGAVYFGGVALDANSGLPLAWEPKLFAGTVLASGNHVYVAGSFTTTELAPAAGFAAFLITGPIDQEAPTITGAAGEGQTLTEHHGNWSPTSTSYTYQWLRCADNPPFQIGCAPIAGATDTTYTLTSNDLGDMIEVQEIATNAEGTSDPVGSVATAAIIGPPSSTGNPEITGAPSIGQTLNCSTASWSGNPAGYQYAWLREFELIPGATNANYVITESDGGHNLACQITATNAAGSATATSSSVAVPVPEETGSGSEHHETPGGNTGSGSGNSQSGSSTPTLTTPIPSTQTSISTSHIETKCVVPNLKHKTLAAAKSLLARAHCKVGKVTKPKGHTHHKLAITHQTPAAKKTLPAGSKVNVGLG